MLLWLQQLVYHVMIAMNRILAKPKPFGVITGASVITAGQELVMICSCQNFEERHVCAAGWAGSPSVCWRPSLSSLACWPLLCCCHWACLQRGTEHAEVTRIYSVTVYWFESELAYQSFQLYINKKGCALRKTVAGSCETCIELPQGCCW